jgi:Carboxypeptidase regulatory-like domain
MRSTLRVQPAVTIVTFRHRRLLAALVIAIATSGNAQTEPSGATVTGTVTDAAGAKVPGASIQLAHPGAPSIQSKTDGRGEFEITAVPGEYVLQTVAPGFLTDKLPVHLSATAPTTTHIVLQIDGWGCGVCISLEPSTIKTLDDRSPQCCPSHQCRRSSWPPASLILLPANEILDARIKPL